MTRMAVSFSPADLQQFQNEFSSFDTNGDGTIDVRELEEILRNLNEFKDSAQLKTLIAEVDTDRSGSIEFNEFLAVISSIRTGKTSGAANFAKVYEKQKELIQVHGNSGGVHSFSQEEMSAFSIHINQVLADDPDLKYLLPIDTNDQDLAKKVHDGVLLSKFINKAVKDTIDVRALNLQKAGKPLSLFQVNENLNLVIASAKAIGVQTINLGASELVSGEKHPHLVLGLVWQLVKLQLLNTINLKNHPELVRLLEEGEELADLLRLPPDQLLVRWFNYHLKNAGHSKRISNFAGDVKDSEAYTVLLNQIAPNRCDKSAMEEKDLTKRADKVLRNAEKLDIHAFIQARDIVKGNARLNLAFTASIFNTCPGLDPLTEEEALELAGIMDDDFGDSREERAFRMWINTLALHEVYVNGLYDDCKDGLVLLKVIDHIEPGIVDWNKVEKKPNNKFKRISNANYVVVLGKQLKFSLVGIGGTDIVDGNKKLVLALTWQLMRRHIIKFLTELGGGVVMSDEKIIQWANDKVSNANRSSRMSSFKDASLKSSEFFFDLLFSVENRIINWELVTPAQTKDDQLLNARYAISVARKLGSIIFLLPEDIVEVKDKMIMTFVAAIMAASLNPLKK
uniref:Calmodulin n=2 Tax=Spongospora subterranea TaxID=70186 RepID=A0A0H5QI20_9EUKA|eukprot:CRZ00971.1 hypothetical protein [Spongospora subterranea]